MWICLCEAVNSGTIIKVIDSGARTVNDVSRVCGAGTECGKCRVTIRSLLQQHAEERKSRS